MCYSAMVREDMRRMEGEYAAHIDYDSFVDLYRQRDLDPSLKIPEGMEVALIEHGGAAGKAIKQYLDRFRVGGRQRLEAEIAVIKEEIQALVDALRIKPTKTVQSKLDTKARRLDKLEKQLRAPTRARGDYRIYPYYFAPVVIQSGAQRHIVPMRYRILPRTGVEVPAQYNVFNARRDSLRSARNWKPLFGRQHAIFPFVNFFEWVERDGRKVEIRFTPEGFDGMWAASLFEQYEHPALGLIRSFAMVTDEPPPEVSAAGHDRCPVFLDRALLDDWLTPTGRTIDQLDALLALKQSTYYDHALAA